MYSISVNHMLTHHIISCYRMTMLIHDRVYYYLYRMILFVRSIFKLRISKFGVWVKQNIT